MALDPITLATVSGVASAVYTQLTPYLKKGAEALSSEVAKSLWAKVTSIFKKPKQQEKLEAWKADPSNDSHKGAVVYILEEALEEDASLLDELREELKRLPSIDEKNNTITQIGDDNIAIQDVKDSKIEIKKG